MQYPPFCTAFIPNQPLYILPLTNAKVDFLDNYYQHLPKDYILFRAPDTSCSFLSHYSDAPNARTNEGNGTKYEPASAYYYPKSKQRWGLYRIRRTKVMATRFTIIIAIFVLRVHNCTAQPCKTYLPVITTPSALAESIKAYPEAAFVSLQRHIPGILIDLRYATTHNFTHKALYRQPEALLRKLPADALRKVQEELKKKGLGLKIYDAYRPFSVSCILWQLATDKRYVANPKRGSHHNRGTALDLTIIHLSTGKELNMGTDFDNFTDSAHHSFLHLPPEVLANRRLLKNIMWKHGFNFVPTEWWHYHWRDKNYAILDLDFDSIQ